MLGPFPIQANENLGESLDPYLAFRDPTRSTLQSRVWLERERGERGGWIRVWKLGYRDQGVGEFSATGS